MILGCSSALQLPVGVARLSAAEPAAAGEAARAREQTARNLARLVAGAQLQVQAPGAAAPTTNTTAANALLRDDDPLGYALSPGTTSLVVALPKIEVLNRFNFLNLTARGKVAIAISSTKLPPLSSQWHAVQATDFSGDNGVVTCDLGSVEAKYVRVTFDVAAEGSIDTFGLYGQRTIRDNLPARGLTAKNMASDTEAGSDLRYVMFNYAVDAPHSGVVMVSPGEDLDRAQQMADGDVGTGYTFQPGDVAPMAVVDLGETRALTRVGASFKAGPGRMSIYLVQDPQQRESSARTARADKESEGRTILDVVTTNFPGDRSPVLAVDTGEQPGLNRVGVNVNGQSGRYLVMMFHPTGTVAIDATTTGADFKDFKDTKAETDFKDVDGARHVGDAPVGNNQPLEVSEITGYGNVPPDSTLVTQTPLTPGVPGVGPGPIAPMPPPISPPGSGTITP